MKEICDKQMGQQLVQLFKQAQDKAGILGKTRMAMKTAVTSANAANVPDDPETLAKARAVLAEL